MHFIQNCLIIALLHLNKNVSSVLYVLIKNYELYHLRSFYIISGRNLMKELYVVTITLDLDYSVIWVRTDSK